MSVYVPSLQENIDKSKGGSSSSSGGSGSGGGSSSNSSSDFIQGEAATRGGKSGYVYQTSGGELFSETPLQIPVGTSEVKVIGGKNQASLTINPGSKEQSTLYFDTVAKAKSFAEQKGINASVNSVSYKGSVLNVGSERTVSSLMGGKSGSVIVNYVDGASGMGVVKSPNAQVSNRIDSDSMDNRQEGQEVNGSVALSRNPFEDTSKDYVLDAMRNNANVNAARKAQVGFYEFASKAGVKTDIVGGDVLAGMTNSSRAVGTVWDSNGNFSINIVEGLSGSDKTSVLAHEAAHIIDFPMSDKAASEVFNWAVSKGLVGKKDSFYSNEVFGREVKSLAVQYLTDIDFEKKAPTAFKETLKGINNLNYYNDKEVSVQVPFKNYNNYGSKATVTSTSVSKDDGRYLEITPDGVNEDVLVSEGRGVNGVSIFKSSGVKSGELVFVDKFASASSSKSGFDSRIEKIRSDEEYFALSSKPGRERVEAAAEVLSFGNPTVEKALGWGLGVVPFFAELPNTALVTGEKLGAVVEGLWTGESRGNTFREVFVNAPNIANSQVKKTFNPFTESGRGNLLGAAFVAGLGVDAKIKSGEGGFGFKGAKLSVETVNLVSKETGVSQPVWTGLTVRSGSQGRPLFGVYRGTSEIVSEHLTPEKILIGNREGFVVSANKILGTEKEVFNGVGGNVPEIGSVNVQLGKLGLSSTDVLKSFVVGTSESKSGFVDSANVLTGTSKVKGSNVPEIGSVNVQLGKLGLSSTDTLKSFIIGDKEGFVNEANRIGGTSKILGTQFPEQTIGLKESLGVNDFRLKAIGVTRAIQEKAQPVKNFLIGDVKGFKESSNDIATYPELGFGVKLDLSKAQFDLGSYEPKSASETRIIYENLPSKYGVDSLEAKQLNVFLRVGERTENVKSAFVQPRIIREVKTLNLAGSDVTLSFAKKNKGQLYGTGVARGQLPIDLQRVTSDWDVFFNTSDVKISPKVDLLVEDLNRVGNVARRNPSKPNLVEVKLDVSKGWTEDNVAHAVDIHTMDSPEAGSGAGLVYGFVKEQPLIRQEGFSVQRLSAQGVSKLQGSAWLGEEKGVSGSRLSPLEHRGKDIPDWFMVQEGLLRSKWFRDVKGEELLKEGQGLFPQELWKDTYPDKILVADFSDKNSPSNSLSLVKAGLIFGGKESGVWGGFSNVNVKEVSVYSPSSRSNDSSSSYVFGSSENILSSPSKSPSPSPSPYFSSSPSKSPSPSPSPYFSSSPSKSPSPYNFPSKNPPPFILINKSSGRSGLFNVFYRRKGKFISAGIFESVELAQGKLRGILKGTLAASGFISKGGERVESNLGFGFTKSRRESGVVVQESRFRLSSFGERGEIQTARRMGGLVL